MRSDQDRRGRKDGGITRGLTFLVDESLGGRVIPDALANAGFRVLTVTAHFGAGTPDETWLAEAGRMKWLVLTADARITRNPLEVAALAVTGVKMFIVSQDIAGPDRGRVVASAAAGMIKFAQGNNAPFVARLSPRGNIKMSITPTQLKKRRPR